MSKILLVEDDPGIRTMYQKLFTKQGFQVTTAVNGQEAVKAVAKELPDIILCDIEMPVMNGVETVKKIKSDQKTKDIPMVMLTNRQDDEFIKQAIEFGAESYIVKTQQDPHDTVTMVHGILNAKK